MPANGAHILASYKKKLLAINGCISVWGDEIGKPGDNFYSLNNVSYDENAKELTLHFGSDNIITINNPGFLSIESNSWRINTADRIRWKSRLSEVDYVQENGVILAKNIYGNKICRNNNNAPAFEFYFW